MQRFNLYLALAATLALLCSCSSDKKKEPLGAVRIHIQANGPGQQISLIRADPVLVSVVPEPILTEANLVSAKVVPVPAGFAIALQFDETGTWTLEQFSAANPGEHFVIFAQWGEKLAEGRWLAAPIITQRITNGFLIFTPDASREEADQLVMGLNRAIKKIHKNDLK